MYSCSLIYLGCRMYSAFLLQQICAILHWAGGVHFSQSLVVGLRLLWDLQVVIQVPVPVLWVSCGLCRGQFLDLVWLDTPLSLLLPGTREEGLVGPYFYWYHQFTYDLIHPKTSNFSTRTLFWVHFKTVHYFFSTNFQFTFTFKNALHNLFIELCSALKIFQIYSIFIY